MKKMATLNRNIYLVQVTRSFTGNVKKAIRGKQKLTLALWDMVAHIVLGLFYPLEKMTCYLKIQNL